MSKLVLRNAFDGSCIDINDLDLESTTPSQIIEAAIENGFLVKVAGKEFIVIDKNNQPVMDDAPLSKLGFEDGDTLTVLSSFYLQTN